MSEEKFRYSRLVVYQDEDGVSHVGFVDRRIPYGAVIGQIGEEFQHLVEEAGEGCRILLNWGNVEYISSALMGELIKFQRAVQEVEGKLLMCRIIPGVYSVFQLTKLDKFFEIFRDEESALKKF